MFYLLQILINFMILAQVLGAAMSVRSSKSNFLYLIL